MGKLLHRVLVENFLLTPNRDSCNRMAIICPVGLLGRGAGLSYLANYFLRLFLL
jgi:hypothetical protein